jgi:hypothetical protein
MNNENNLLSEINLEFLMNKSSSKVKSSQSINTTNKNKRDTKFYRKRIYDLTKHLLNEDEPTQNYSADIKKSFQQYIRTCIDYFKILDTTDILQENYADLLDDSHNPSPITPPDDMAMLRSIKITEPNSLEKLVTVKRTNPHTKIHIPIQQTINIKDPVLKNKGIRKKKNIINNYDSANKKDEKNEKNEKN